MKVLRESTNVCARGLAAGTLGSLCVDADNEVRTGQVTESHVVFGGHEYCGAA